MDLVLYWFISLPYKVQLLLNTFMSHKSGNIFKKTSKLQFLKILLYFEGEARH